MRRVWGAVVAVVAAAGIAAAGASVALATPAPPSKDPFYSYRGSLRKIAPGTVLRTRQIETSANGTQTPYPATQLLYRTTNQLGQPAATAATIIKPSAPTPVKLLSYQTAYDGDSATCRPSFQLEGGQPTNGIVEAETPLILNFVQQGFTVVTSDYEGPTDDYGAGREEGRGTLDAIKGAEHQLALPPATPVGLIGYSGGSIASMWAAEEQPTYAPTVHLNGVAAGGIPVDFIHNLAYINGSSDWAGAIPSVGLGLARAYQMPILRFLSPRGKQILRQVSKGCLNPSAYPGLKFEDLLKPRYKDWRKVPILYRGFNDSIMGRETTPTEPLLMGVGNADGTGDGVMVAKDVQQLAHEYCVRGDNVQFHVYNGDDHVQALPQFEAEAVQFLQQRYNGATPTSGCSSITPGNSLTPLPRPVLKLTVSRKTIAVGKRTLLRLRLFVRLSGRNYPLSRALIVIGRHHVLTDSKGRATVRLRFAHRGRVRMHAGPPGYNTARARLQVGG